MKSAKPKKAQLCFIKFMPVILFLHFSSVYAFENDFIIYEDIGQRGKPDMRTYGMISLRAIPERELLRKDSDQLDREKIDKAIRKHKNFHGIVCLDIERWSTSTEDSVELQSSIDKYKMVARTVKSLDEDASIGFYGMLPVRNYYAPAKASAPMLEQWHSSNVLLQPIADSVDIIFPSLYAFNKDRVAWQRYAITNIAQARIYNKPVIAFLWPQIHPSNLFQGLEFVSYEFWKMQLRTVYAHADAVVIWSPWGAERTNFDESAPWWLATLDFIDEMHGVESGSGGEKGPQRPAWLEVERAQ